MEQVGSHEPGSLTLGWTLSIKNQPAGRRGRVQITSPEQGRIFEFIVGQALWGYMRNVMETNEKLHITKRIINVFTRLSSKSP